MPKIIAIIGPTASGKTSLSIKIAKRFNGEVISADSRQVYRGMDLGAGKITKREMDGIPHHLLDVASPKRTFTAAHYQRLGNKAIKAVLAKRKLPIIVGGTGFYIDSLLYGYNLPSVKPDFGLRKKLESRSATELFRQLEKCDPRRAHDIDRHNKRRLVRALEIVIGTKQPVPSREEAIAKKKNYDILAIGLMPVPQTLKKNIARRLAKRLRGGMIEEVRKLHSRDGISFKRLDGFGLEYRYVSRYLLGIITKQEMIGSINKESWQYAKRQMTWFKRDTNIHWMKDSRKTITLAKNFVKK